MNARTFVLQPEPHPARKNAAQAVLEAPNGYSVRLAPPRKSRDQEEKYHAMFTDIARQMPLHGKLRDSETVKRLCVDQFWRDTKDDPDLAECWQDMREQRQIENLPSLDGSGVVSLGWQSRRFPKKLASAFVEWLYALGAEGDVIWSEPKAKAPELRGTRARARAIEAGNVDAETGEIAEAV